MSRFFRRLFHKRSILGSQKLLRRQRVVQGLKIVVGVLLFVGFFWSLSYISAVPSLTIQHIIVSGNSVVPTDAVLSVAENALRGNYDWIFSRANFLWYPKSEIADTLKYSYSWIDTVSVERKNLTTIEIKIKERAPVAVWCGKTSASPEPCKLMDAGGYVFALAPDFSGSAYLRLYGPLTSASWRGAKFFSDSGRAHIFAFTKGLTEISLTPIAAEVSLDSVQEEYTLILNSGTRLRVQVADAVGAIISNLQSLLAQKDFVASASHNFSDLTSIDLRFGSKIFYKFKDVAPILPMATSTATSS